jgi:hypothetical protein
MKPTAAAFPTDYKGKPWKGVAQVIPGRVKMAYYDLGGEGLAYHDSNPTVNEGSGTLNKGPTELDHFREKEGVDTTYTKPDLDKTVDGVPEKIGELYVGWTVPGEWVNVTVNVQKAGTYRVRAHVSSNNVGAEISLGVNGVDVTGPLVIESTGHWHTWRMIENLAEITLEKGPQLLTLHFLKEGQMNVDYFEFVAK